MMCNIVATLLCTASAMSVVGNEFCSYEFIAISMGKMDEKEWKWRKQLKWPYNEL